MVGWIDLAAPHVTICSTVHNVVSRYMTPKKHTQKPELSDGTNLPEDSKDPEKVKSLNFNAFFKASKCIVTYKF